VSGATGNIGSTAVLIALAMGAKRVVALGREESVLNQIKDIDRKRIDTVKLNGNLETDKRSVAAIAAGADLVYDMLGGTPSFATTAAAIYALRRGGTAVLMGGVHANIDLPYSHVMLNELTIKGALMYSRSAPRQLINMMAAGLLDLSKAKIATFSLEHIKDALDHAERLRGLSYSVLTP
jgi:alcohol dehydrogenase